VKIYDEYIGVPRWENKIYRDYFKIVFSNSRGLAGRKILFQEKWALQKISA